MLRHDEGIERLERDSRVTVEEKVTRALGCVHVLRAHVPGLFDVYDGARIARRCRRPEGRDRREGATWASRRGE